MDSRELIEGLRGEPTPEHWDPASGGAYMRELWAPDAETANAINRQLALDARAERVAALRWAADGFEADARQLPLGATFTSGPLYQASVHNVNMRTARKLRELADAVEAGDVSPKLEAP